MRLRHFLACGVSGCREAVQLPLKERTNRAEQERLDSFSLTPTDAHKHTAAVCGAVRGSKETGVLFFFSLFKVA